MAVDFEVLPFAVNPPVDLAPPSEQLGLRHESYPVAYAALIRGIDFVLRNGGVDAVNLSLGPSGFAFNENDPLQLATRFTHESGTCVVVAAGNDGPKEGTLQPLAQAPWVISVGATDANESLLDSSSRGWRSGPHPTVVAWGQPAIEFIAEDIPRFGPSTSFAAPRVARLAILIAKSLELVLGALQDCGSGAAKCSRPIGLARFGLVDTGVDPRAANALPSEVANVLRQGGRHLAFAFTPHQQKWIRFVARFLREKEIPLVDAAPSPDCIKRALEQIATKIPSRHVYEVGAGKVSDGSVLHFLSHLTPSKLISVVFPDFAGFIDARELIELDASVGPLWDLQYVVGRLLTCFHAGQLSAVAKVVR